MQLLNPTITIRNTDSQHWLVSLEHDFGNGEAAHITVKVPRGDQPVSNLQREALARAQHLLHRLANNQV